MNRFELRTACVLGWLATSAIAAGAQPAALQQSYEQQIARCNDGSLAAPAREACIRAAGTARDRAAGGIPPTPAAMTTPDGRATVVAPEGSTAGSGGSGTTTSGDGRATIVPPAGSATPR
ncbi:MAG: hypothetical protein ABWZ88_12400 [Variovorax sp.]